MTLQKETKTLKLNVLKTVKQNVKRTKKLSAEKTKGLQNVGKMKRLLNVKRMPKKPNV